MTKEHRDTCHLTPTQELGQAFVARGITGSVVMLNLLRLFGWHRAPDCRFGSFTPSSARRTAVAEAVIALTSRLDRAFVASMEISRQRRKGPPMVQTLAWAGILGA
jgi:hypothetical protein